MKDWLRAKAFARWTQFGHRFFGFHQFGMYAPDGEIVAITFSRSEEYLDHVELIELD